MGSSASTRHDTGFSSQNVMENVTPRTQGDRKVPTQHETSSTAGPGDGTKPKRNERHRKALLEFVRASKESTARCWSQVTQERQQKATVGQKHGTNDTEQAGGAYVGQDSLYDVETEVSGP